jgi:myo-inositol-1(or 4)-monophosphatase
MNSAPQLADLTQFALQLVRDAGPIAMRFFRQPTSVMNKAAEGGFDPVTEADRGIENMLRERIQAMYPGHGIAGEEQGVTAGKDEWTWYIDPIDGTSAYMSGMPAWGIMLGLKQGDTCVLGIVHQPFLEETFVGAGGVTVLYSKGERRTLAARATVELHDAVLYCTSPDMFAQAAERAAFEALVERCRMRRFGGDCYAYCLLAMGFVDLVVEACLKPYDIAPLIPIVTGAGGVMSSWTGTRDDGSGRMVAAANPGLHEQAVQVLRRYLG